MLLLILIAPYVILCAACFACGLAIGENRTEKRWQDEWDRKHAGVFRHLPRTDK